MSLKPVWLQQVLFPDVHIHVTRPDNTVGMNDHERDARSGLQWINAVKAYLEFREGVAWRRKTSERNSPQRLEYLAAIRLLNGVGAPQFTHAPMSLPIPPGPEVDPQLKRLTDFNRNWLVDQLMQARPELTNRKILSAFTRLKLATLLLEARPAFVIPLSDSTEAAA